MRFSQVSQLVRLFFVYFFRKVLNVGLLKNPLFKIFLGLALVIMLFVMTGLMYVFFTEVGNQNQEVDLILRVYSITIALWTIVIFIFLKILFSKSSQFLKMTFALPVNMKERNLALLLFEVFMTFFIITMISFSVAMALLIIYGSRYLGTIVSNTVYLSMSLYLMLQLLYSLLGWGLEKIKLSKIKTPLLFFTYTGCFLIFFNQSSKLSTQILVSYLNKVDAPQYPMLIWDRLNSSLGFGMTTGIFILTATLLIAKLVYIPDYAYLQQNNFYKLFDFSKLFGFSRHLSYLWAYFLTMMRRTENFNFIVIAYLIFFYLIYVENYKWLLWPIFVFSVNGIYLYIQTEEIRFLQFKLGYSAWRDYLYLLLSQLMWGGMLSLPIFIMYLYKGNSILSLLYVFLLYVFSIVMFTMVGILFPPKKENPFSVFLSFFIVAVSFSVIGFSVFILNLPELWNKVALGFVFLASIFISIQGLLKLKEESQHEKILSDF